MKRKFTEFMYGRYGTDELSKFLTYVGLAFLILSVFLGQPWRTALFVPALIAVGLSYYRSFSRKLEKRRAENAKFLKRKRGFEAFFRLRRDIWRQRKEYRFFRCPSCKAVLRVPRGKGKIRVVCRKCGTAFEKKS